MSTAPAVPTKPSSKIIQILVTPGYNDPVYCQGRLICLCADGSVWFLNCEKDQFTLIAEMVGNTYAIAATSEAK